MFKLSPLAFSAILLSILAAAGCDGGTAGDPTDRSDPADGSDAVQPAGDTGLQDDTGAPDSGVADAGVTDAGVADAGVTDAGTTDSGVHDAGAADAGTADAGRIMIHFIDVGQGDGIVIVTPGGKAVLVDSGALNKCAKPVNYIKNLKLAEFSHIISSHYHSDHIGCTAAILLEVPIAADGFAFDRGGSYSSNNYNDYVAAVGAHRKTADTDAGILLDDGSVRIEIAALNGNGISTTNENDLSVAAVLRFGSFDLSLAGDLSGFNTGSYDDIETSVAPRVGRVELYKVNHHCSQYSSNTTWLDTLMPKAAIIMVGDGNTYGHPDADCLARLHARGIETYWTATGAGGAPEPAYDKVAGDIVVNAGFNGSFDVTWDGGSKTYPGW
jgi:beta-lactamase superfamily II metal-dependent hydrolase